MRLTKAQIEDLSRRIIRNLKDRKLVTINAPEDKVHQRTADIFTNDLKAEDDLDREVEKVLEAHKKDFESGKAEYRKMFNKVKEKLAKERDIVL